MTQLSEERVRPGHGQPRLLDAAYPRNDAAVVEADHEFRAHRHAAVEPFHDPDDFRGVAARRHEVDRADPALDGLEYRAEDQRVVPIAALLPRDLGRWRSDQRPFSGPPRSAAKQAPESKRGKQHQSIEPLRSMSAAVCRSPRSA